jgi:mannose-6-phosphate isomerase-like protein (cupin superfamily)
MKQKILDIKYVPKGWGHEKWIVNKPEYCGKLLTIDAGKNTSWHFHKLKDEVFFLQAGKLKILYSVHDDISSAHETMLYAGQAFHVYPTLRHRICAIEDSEMFEFSTQHFDEDSYRILGGS